MVKNNTLALCASVCLCLLASSAHAESSQVFAGYHGWTDYDFGYVGGVTALNHDMKADGWLVRGTAGYGAYSYSTMAVNGKVDVDLTNADAMIGYQKFLSINNGNGRIAGYLGVDYLDHDLNKADNGNSARGDEFGLMGRVEIRLPLDAKTYINEEGSYSSAFDSYISSTRYGFMFDKITVGPEIEFLGNEAFDSQHFGLFIGDIRIADTLTASLSGGYEHSSRQFSGGGYGNVYVAYGF